MIIVNDLKPGTAIEYENNIYTVLEVSHNKTAMRQMIAQPPVNKLDELQQEMKELKRYIEEVFSDQNDINEDTRMQLELINQTLAELQTQKRFTEKPRKPIGFIQPKDTDKSSS